MVIRSEWDGYRGLVIKDGQQVRIYSRNRRDLTRSYPEIASAALKLKVEQAILDGEIVALDDKGHPDFQALQNWRAGGRHHLAFYTFDLLHRNGRDLTGEPLMARRKRLDKVLAIGAVIRPSIELNGSASEVIEVVRSHGLEGVVAKRRNSPYRSGDRSGDWLKCRLDQQQEFVIGGFRPNGRSVDCVLVGYYEGSTLRFAGKVHAGFTPHVRRELREKLQPLEIGRCPFKGLPTGRSRWGSGVTEAEMRHMIWVRAALVVQIRFLEWTADGRLRHSAFLGLRADKAAKQVKREG